MAIVDLGLPDIDGIEVERIRQWSPMPILILSARAQERSKIEALDAGADDYVTKPFAVGELLARVRVALRHATRSRSGSRVLRLSCDGGSGEPPSRPRRHRGAPDTDRVSAAGGVAKHLDMVVTHRQLLAQVWGPTHENDTHYLRIYMKQLRDKLERDPIRPRHFLTEIGVGYRLTAIE